MTKKREFWSTVVNEHNYYLKFIPVQRFAARRIDKQLFLDKLKLNKYSTDFESLNSCLRTLRYDTFSEKERFDVKKIQVAVKKEFGFKLTDKQIKKWLKYPTKNVRFNEQQRKNMNAEFKKKVRSIRDLKTRIYLFKEDDIYRYVIDIFDKQKRVGGTYGEFDKDKKKIAIREIGIDRKYRSFHIPDKMLKNVYSSIYKRDCSFHRSNFTKFHTEPITEAGKKYATRTKKDFQEILRGY